MTFRQSIYLLRPHTLIASAAPVLVALWLSYWQTNSIRPLSAVLCLLVALLAQMLSNVANDIFDFKKGADGKDRRGFERPLASGKISYREVKRMAYLLASLTAVAGIILVAINSWYLLIVGVLVLVGAIVYTGGPFPLAYKGLGEVMVFLFYGLIACGVTYYIQMGDWSLECFLLASSMGFANANILVVNNYRDYESDRMANKKTLLVRFGKELGLHLYMTNLLASVLVLYPFFTPITLLLIGIYLLVMMRSYRHLKQQEGGALNAVLVETARGVLYLLLLMLPLVFIHYYNIPNPLLSPL